MGIIPHFFFEARFVISEKPAPLGDSVTSARSSTGSQESDSSQTAKKDMLAALKARQEALEETLRQRLEELRSICIREAVRPMAPILTVWPTGLCVLRGSATVYHYRVLLGAYRKAT